MSCKLNYSRQQQAQQNWCWAAVSASIWTYYGRPPAWTQCDIVNAELGQSTCCANGSSTACDQPWYLDKALTRVGCYQGPGVAPLPLMDCQSEICNSKRPVGVRIQWAGGGGHFVVLTGIGAESSPLLVVEDPWYGTSFVTHAVLSSSYKGLGSWSHTYFTK